MPSAKSLGRIAGALSFVQLTGLIVPFILMKSAVTPAFLQDAAQHAMALRAAVLLLLSSASRHRCFSMFARIHCWRRHSL